MNVYRCPTCQNRMACRDDMPVPDCPQCGKPMEQVAQTTPGSLVLILALSLAMVGLLAWLIVQMANAGPGGP